MIYLQVTARTRCLDPAALDGSNDAAWKDRAVVVLRLQVVMEGSVIVIYYFYRGSRMPEAAELNTRLVGCFVHCRSSELHGLQMPAAVYEREAPSSSVAKPRTRP